jgi:hypothetical protein
MQKNDILLVNLNTNSMNNNVLEDFLNIIDASDLPEFEKNYEKNLASRVFLDGAMNLDVLRNEFENTKFQNLYGFLAGRTDIPIIENQLQVNTRFFNAIGNVGATLGGTAGNLAAGLLGTSTTCGIIGSIFNTKKCREKQQAQQGLTSPQTAFASSTLTKPSEQFITLPPPQLSQPPQQLSFQKEVQSRAAEKGFLEKNWVYLVVGAVALYFLFFRKRRKL